MVYKIFRREAVPSRAKNNKVLEDNFFAPTHLTVFNKKNCLSKLSVKMFIKRKIRAGKAYAYRMLLSFKRQ